jgi:hypothetical protein
MLKHMSRQTTFDFITKPPSFEGSGRELSTLVLGTCQKKSRRNNTPLLEINNTATDSVRDLSPLPGSERSG